MKRLATLALSSALTLTTLFGCSQVSDFIQRVPAKVSGFVDNALGREDLVDLYKQHPEFLTQFLENFTGTDGLAAEVSPFSITYDLKGKHDELVVKAIYTLTPANDGRGRPNLSGYIVYDVKEEATYSYTAVDADSPTPELPDLSDQPKQYKLDDKKI